MKTVESPQFKFTDLDSRKDDNVEEIVLVS